MGFVKIDPKLTKMLRVTPAGFVPGTWRWTKEIIQDRVTEPHVNSDSQKVSQISRIFVLRRAFTSLLTIFGAFHQENSGNSSRLNFNLRENLMKSRKKSQDGLDPDDRVQD